MKRPPIQLVIVLVVTILSLLIWGCADAVAPAKQPAESLYQAVDRLNAEIRAAYARGERYTIGAYNTDNDVPPSLLLFRKP